MELLQRFGKGAWLTHCEELEKIKSDLQKRLETVQSQLQTINATRAQEQTDAGGRLHDLEVQLTQLIGRDFELQLAIQRLAAEVKIIRMQAGER